jgi:MFS family permease
MPTSAGVEDKPTKSMIPARMHDMPWSRFHWMVIFGLGTAWILDGLEVQIVAAGGFEETLDMSAADVGLAGTVYLLGEVAGALLFGRLTDTLGRKKMFTMTLTVYLVGAAAAGLAPNMWIFLLCRFVSGMGIGGEYSAVNSAIDELIPGKHRGRVDLAINGTYWAGAALGAVASSILLDTDRFAENVGWRIAFFIGPVLGLAIIYLRRHIPESPRWMVTHGHADEAEKIVSAIEDQVRDSGQQLPHHDESEVRWIKAGSGLTPKQLLYVFFKLYPTRTVLGLVLMITQSFLYNAIFFTYALVLKNFYGLSAADAALFFFPFAVGNLLGPLLLGPLFDTVGRRKMIGGCYAISGIVLGLSAVLFQADALTATTHTAFWCVSFFFGASTPRASPWRRSRHH